jgi:hypothetical protein
MGPFWSVALLNTFVAIILCNTACDNPDLRLFRRLSLRPLDRMNPFCLFFR